MTSSGRALVLSKVSEEEWLQQVRTWAKRGKWLAYHTRDSRRSDNGFLDLVLVKPSTGEIIYAELKAERGKVSDEQQAWIDALAACGQRVFVWRPSDEVIVRKMLGV